MALSTEPKADCETVMNFGLPLAGEILTRHGEFLPFGAAMRPNGEIVCLGAYDARSYPSLAGSFAELIRSLKETLVAGARRLEYIATALFYEVAITLAGDGERIDAIAVSLDHRDGYSVIVLLPYKIEDGKIIYDTPRAEPGEADIFPSG
jgi:hypothetical protein